MAPTRGLPPRHFTQQEKIALVTKIDRLYRTGGISLTAAATAAGTTVTSYNAWLAAGIRPLPQEPTRATSRRYMPSERKRLVAEVDRLQAGGKSVAAACREVGVSGESYTRWREELVPAAPMRPVEIRSLVPAPSMAVTVVPPLLTPVEEPPPRPSELVLVAPGGYRLEGLGVETAAALLRALA